jgi:hypothetical protein
MILLDCEVSYFGGYVTNGVPVLRYTGDEMDSELLHIEDYMM